MGLSQAFGTSSQSTPTSSQCQAMNTQFPPYLKNGNFLSKGKMTKKRREGNRKAQLQATFSSLKMYLFTYFIYILSSSPVSPQSGLYCFDRLRFILSTTL